MHFDRLDYDYSDEKGSCSEDEAEKQHNEKDENGAQSNK
jgi:hypothetical protein